MQNSIVDLDTAIKRGEKLPVKDYGPDQRGELVNKLQVEFDTTRRQVHSGYLNMGKNYFLTVI